MQPHSLKLSPESDLINSIKEYSLSNNLYGYVSGVVGNLRTVCIQCPGNQEINKFEGNLEIVALNGHFNKGDVHLHLSFADEGCNVFGGHLEEGCIVKKGINGNTRKRRDVDNKLGIFNAKFLRFFLNNNLVFVYKKYITLSTSLNF